MITLQEAKEFLRVDGDDEENLITFAPVGGTYA